MKYYHIKLFSYVSLLLLVAAPGYGSRYQSAVKCADKKAQKKYYAMAAERYERILACRHFPADSAYAVKIKLANCYMKMENTIKAEANFADAVKSGKADALTTFCYARSLEANDKYADAKEWFDKIADDPALKDKNVKGFSKICEKALKAHNSNRFDITRESFNTTASEYAPAYYKKGIVYTSNKNERFNAAQKTMWNKERFTDLYIVQEDNKGDLKATDKMPAPINSRLNDGAASFNASYDEVFFTRNNKRRKSHDQLQILCSKYDGTNWSRPHALSFEMPGTNYAHPMLSADGNTLYFSSDLASNTFGGMDIFMVTRNGNAWGTPVNMGDKINTAGNETFPYMAANGSLYFTSDGWPGYGGMDIFYAKLTDSALAKAENMGADFNSSKDDLSAIVDTKNRTGYFASNRAGDDDIYSFRLPVSKDDREMDKLEAMRSGKIIDKNTNLPIPGARVEISKPGNQTSGSFYYTNDNGEFFYTKKIDPNDEVKVMKDNYKVASMSGSNIADSKAFEITMDQGAAATAPSAAAGESRQNFATIYYDINKSDLTNRDIDLLRPVVDAAKSNAGSKVSISGYADEQGGDTYNYGLSLRRVRGVADYLAGQGVDTQKIHSDCFGAVKLSDKCRRDPKCARDTDRENRRVEVYITSQK